MRSRDCAPASLAAAGERLRLAMNQVLPKGSLPRQDRKSGLRFRSLLGDVMDEGLGHRSLRPATPGHRARCQSPPGGAMDQELAPRSLPRPTPDSRLAFQKSSGGVMDQGSAPRSLRPAGPNLGLRCRGLSGGVLNQGLGHRRLPSPTPDGGMGNLSRGSGTMPSWLIEPNELPGGAGRQNLVRGIGKAAWDVFGGGTGRITPPTLPVYDVPVAVRRDYSTVTLFAKLRGLSTSQPRATAV